MHIVDGAGPDTERPLAIYTKGKEAVTVLFKDLGPVVLRPGESVVISYTATEALELEIVAESRW